jgi:hypothetical protein
LGASQHGEAAYHEPDEEARIFTEQGEIILPIIFAIVHTFFIWVLI